MFIHLEWKQVAAIAGKELQERIRSRWLFAVVCIFTAFALAIAYFGAAQQGALGLRNVEVTIASLVSLVIYLVPLISLMLGYDAIIGEREKGSLGLLLSMPISRFELLLGKYLGLAAALVASTLAGFGSVGILLAVKFGAGVLPAYGAFMASAVALGMSYLSISLLISVTARSRVSASGMAIFAWFGFVLVYDLVLLALLVALPDKLSPDVVPALLLLNPADVFRMLNLLGFAEAGRLYGLAAVMPASLATPSVQGAAMLVWIVFPLVVASRRFK